MGIGIPVATGNELAITMANAGHAPGASAGRHIEAPTRPHQHPSYMPAGRLQPGWDTGTHQIASGEAEVVGLPGPMADRETGAIRPTQLAPPMPSRPDQQGHNPCGV